MWSVWLTSDMIQLHLEDIYHGINPFIHRLFTELSSFMVVNWQERWCDMAEYVCLLRF